MDVATHLERLTELHALFERWLFPRGFCLSRSFPTFVPSRWRLSRIGTHWLHVDPDMPFFRHVSREAELILLGDAFDLRAPARGGEEVAVDLLQKLDESESAFLSELDWVHGRFLILYQRSGESLRAVHDATGMRPAFHPRGGGLVASHASLAGVNTDASHSLHHGNKFGLRGRQTSFSDVVLLVPNHMLDVDSGEVTRYYPRERLPEVAAAEAVEEAVDVLVAAIGGVLHRFRGRVHASLTAGLDSRTTLAVARDGVADMRFFTYFRADDQDTDSTDRAVASALAADLCLDHRTIDLRSLLPELGRPLKALLDENSHYRHIHGAAWSYRLLFADSDGVHLRSNLSEIARGFYSHRCDKPPRTAEELAELYSSFSRHMSDADRTATRAAFAEYYEVTRFDEAAELRDARDLLYWEHRMGTWHSALVLESDIAFQTLSVFNCRKVLEVLMAPPLHERRAGTLFYGILRAAWPELLRYPVNPKADALAKWLSERKS